MRVQTWSSRRMLPIILSTFAVIFLAELPDKTALATLVLATRYSVRQVVLGAWLAFLVQTLVAIAAGSIFQLLPGQLVRAAAGVGFLVFAIVAIRKDEQELIEEEEEEVEAAGRRHWAPWM